MAMKSTTKSQLATGKSSVAMYFNDISPGLSESQLRFRLIHFWEAKNIAKGGTLIGIELLLIDEQVSSNPQLLLFRISDMLQHIHAFYINLALYSSSLFSYFALRVQKALAYNFLRWDWEYYYK